MPRKRIKLVELSDEFVNEDTIINQHTSLTRPQEIMGEAIEHLQGRQRDVYFLTMRQGLSEYEAAALLTKASGTSVSRNAVKMYKSRALRFITQYCLEAMKRDEQDNQ